MTDNRTTELRISEPLRGFIRHQSNRAYIDGGQARWLTKIADEIDERHEQAVAATLGSGECKMIPSFIEPREMDDCQEFCCSKCGKQIGVVRNCEMYIACDGRQAWKSLDHEVCDVPNYCPNCGAKVVE